MQNAEAKEKLDGVIITTIHNSIAFRVLEINGFGLGLGVTRRTCVAAVCFWCMSLLLLLLLLLLGCSANDTTRHVIFYVMLQLLLREKGERRKEGQVCVCSDGGKGRNKRSCYLLMWHVCCVLPSTPLHDLIIAETTTTITTTDDVVLNDLLKNQFLFS